MQAVPTTPVPSQTLQCQLNNQPCTINLVQTVGGILMTLYVGATLIVASSICQNRNRIVRMAYTGFLGDFCFLDMEGEEDPVYTGLGSRYFLLYLDPTEIP